jgi:peptide chain release factor subunit 1
MFTRANLQRLIQRPVSDNPILSVYLDMSVTSDNKRTYGVFLNQQRSRFADADRYREEIANAFDLVEGWVETGFDKANKGVALFLEIGGDGFESFQFPVAVECRVELGERPIIAPLARLLDEHQRHVVIVVDREHIRLLKVVFGTVQEEKEIRPDAIDTPHDVQAGGYSQSGYQRRKAEEVRHFFKDFVQEVSEFVRRHQPDDLIVLGTAENVKSFVEFLPDHLRELIAFTESAPGDAPAPVLIDRLIPLFEDQMRRSEAAVVTRVRDRVKERHFAASGFQETLEQLQEGKVDTLVVARDAERSGAQCTQCGFYLPRLDPKCPYCGGQTRDSVDLVEVMIRMAADQEVAVEFVRPQSLDEVHGVAALLKF